MNKVSGKVMLRETWVGVRDLVISVFAVDPRTPQTDIDRLNADNYKDLISGARIGSAVSDNAGAFVLEYEDADFQSSESLGRPALLVVVTAPEDCSRKKCPQVLHLSCELRHRAGRVENYLIYIGLNDLKKAGLPIPGILPAQAVAAKDVAQALEDARVRMETIQQTRGEHAQPRIAKMQERVKQLKKQGGTELYLTSVVEEVRASVRYVGGGQSVNDATVKSINADIAASIHNKDSPATTKGMVYVSTDQRDALKGDDGKYRRDLTVDDLGKAGITARIAGGPSVVLVREDPHVRCRKLIHPDETCKPVAAEVGPAAGDGHVAGDAGGDGHPAADGFAVTTKDIPRFLGTVLQDLGLPDGAPPGAIGGRATPGDVQVLVDTLTLKGGPADVPSYFDFQNLQIAFGYVWSELFDADVLARLMQAYGGILDLGGDPPPQWTRLLFQLDPDEPIHGPCNRPGHSASRGRVLPHHSRRVVGSRGRSAETTHRSCDRAFRAPAGDHGRRLRRSSPRKHRA